MDSREQTQIPIRHSRRAKRMSIQVHPDGHWEVVVPSRRPPSDQLIRRFVSAHEEWIKRHLSRAQISKPQMRLNHQGIPRTTVESQTRACVRGHMEDLCVHYPFQYRRVRLGNFRSQWGSCSRQGNISFHYKLSLLPGHLSYYIVAHELCHTVHLNHSKAFWALVQAVCPDMEECRQELKQYAL